MYTERFSLPFIARVLITAAERRRPGLGPWKPEVRDELRKVFETELAEIRARYLELFDDRDYWARVEKVLLEDTFPRYCAIAEKQTALEQRDYGLWRGGDLLSRIVLGFVGIGAGVFIARAPFIPLPLPGDIVVYLAALATPFLPDLQVWLHDRRFRKGVDRVVKDMASAADQQRLYQPLPLPEPIAPISVEEDSHRPAISAGRKRNPQEG